MSIQIETKYLDRRGWQRVTDSSFAWMELHAPALDGAAGLIQIKTVTAPLAVRDLDRMVTIADDGYCWLQVAPTGQRWWLTVMYDRDLRPLQYYFDITRENFIQGADSRFEDLMLDVVLFSDGVCGLMDRDELDAALAAGNITPEEHRMACETARELLENVPRRAEELAAFCLRVLEDLRDLGPAGPTAFLPPSAAG